MAGQAEQVEMEQGLAGEDAVAAAAAEHVTLWLSPQ
jgi:hypothetical protein